MSYQDTLPAGSLINGEYQIVRLLGSGGFANTYLARDLTLQRDVAIKEYFPREIATRTSGTTVSAKSKQFEKNFDWGLQRFTREAKIIARFKHPNVIRIFRILDAHHTAYIVLEYVEGADMEVFLKKRSDRLRQSECDELLDGLLVALEKIHAEGVLHRDVKPANIYVRASDSTPVLLDFGASKFDIGGMTGTTAAIVSRGYSPQEAYAADSKMQGPWTDIYGLAATLYFALSDHAPPEATERVLRDEMVPATGLPLRGYRPSFLAAIDWGLKVQPSQRPQSITQWRTQLLHGTDHPATNLPLAPTGAPGQRQGAPRSSQLQSQPGAPSASGANRLVSASGSRPVPASQPKSAGQSGARPSSRRPSEPISGIGQPSSAVTGRHAATTPAGALSQPVGSTPALRLNSPTPSGQLPSVNVAQPQLHRLPSRRSASRPQKSLRASSVILGGIGILGVCLLTFAGWRWIGQTLNGSGTASLYLPSPDRAISRNSEPSYTSPPVAERPRAAEPSRPRPQIRQDDEPRSNASSRQAPRSAPEPVSAPSRSSSQGPINLPQ